MLQDRIRYQSLQLANHGEQAGDWLMCVGPMLFGHRYAGSVIRQMKTKGSTPVINLMQGAVVSVGVTLSARQG